MKSYSHSYHYGKRISWRAIVISLTITGCAYASHLGQQHQLALAQDEKVVEFPKAEVQVVTAKEPKPHNPSKEEVVQLIKQYFPKNSKTMIAVAMAESHLDHNAQNWNCWYNKNETMVYKDKVKGSHSTSCHKEDRVYSWSVDCGVLMKNYIAQECPQVPVEEHIKEMAELSKKRGFTPWMAFVNKSYLAYLK